MYSESQVLRREVEKFRRKDSINPVPRLELSTLDVDDLERLGSLALHTAKKKRDPLDTNPELTPSSNVNLINAEEAHHLRLWI